MQKLRICPFNSFIKNSKKHLVTFPVKTGGCIYLLKKLFLSKAYKAIKTLKKMIFEFFKVFLAKNRSNSKFKDKSQKLSLNINLNLIYYIFCLDSFIDMLYWLIYTVYFLLKKKI